ncbi:MAG: EpsG family protein, partial [Bacteroidales bacterium]|nr:EpsG family protein [Bacteroidales bacterium]
MNAIFILVVLILVLRLNLSRYREHSPTRARWERWSCYFVFAIFLLLTSFRGENVGVDTAQYILDYQGLEKLSFIDIQHEYEDYLLYYYLSKIFSLLHIPIWGWFAFIGILYLSSIWRLISKYSSDKLFSTLIFISIGLFSFSLAGMKQTLSMALTLHSLLFFINKRYLFSLLLFIG